VKTRRSLDATNFREVSAGWSARVHPHAGAGCSIKGQPVTYGSRERVLRGGRGMVPLDRENVTPVPCPIRQKGNTEGNEGDRRLCRYWRRAGCGEPGRGCKVEAGRDTSSALNFHLSGSGVSSNRAMLGEQRLALPRSYRLPHRTHAPRPSAAR
jgi:hypothetical protein